MAGDPYVHIDILLTESISSFLKQAKSTSGISTQLKSKLEQIPANAKTVKFSHVLEALENMKTAGLPNLPPIWKLVQLSGIVLPEPYIPPRDIIVQQRVERLAQKFANMEYGRMTSSLPPLGFASRYKSTGFDEVRCMKRQILMVVNFVIVVVGSFFFGYFLSDMFGHSQATSVQRIICGFSLALIVFFADLYFLVKNVDSCDSNQVPAEPKRST